MIRRTNSSSSAAMVKAFKRRGAMERSAFPGFPGLPGRTEETGVVFPHVPGEGYCDLITLPPTPRPSFRLSVRTSTASSRSQWALPDLNRELQIAVGTAGPQPRAPDLSGHCRTSTASSRSQWALPEYVRI